MPSLLVRPVTTPSEMEACYTVRFAVFVDEQAVPAEEELDHYDPVALHLLAEQDGSVVGTARVVYLERTAKIGRVAVLKQYRGLGIGRALMLAALDQATRGCDLAILDAQVQVIPFYERLGFVAEGPVFLDAGIEHRRMTRHLATPQE